MAKIDTRKGSNGQGRVTKEKNRDGRAVPEYSLFSRSELSELKESWMGSLPGLLQHHGISGLTVVGALVAFCYIVHGMVSAGSNLTTQGLAGAVMVALMVLALGMVALLVARRSDAENTEEQSNATAEPRNE